MSGLDIQRAAVIGGIALVLVAAFPVAAFGGSRVKAPTIGATSDQAVAFQIDSAHSGDQPSDPLTPPLTQRWSLDLGGPVSYPLIAGGIIYVTAGYTGGSGARLFALDQGTGHSVWGPIDLGGGGWFSGAAYDAGRVFATNALGVVRAFDAQTGVLQWSTRLMSGEALVAAPPVARNGFVYIGGAEAGSLLYALRETDGSIAWWKGGMDADTSVAAVSDAGVYQVYGCREAQAFQPATGTVLWDTTPTCTAFPGSMPVLYSGRLYARESTGTPGVVADVVLDPATGTQVGTFTSTAAPAFDGSMGFFLVDNTLHAQAVGSNVDSWTFSGDGLLVTAPVIVNGIVYVGSGAGALYGLNASTGQQVWTANAGAAVSYRDSGLSGGSDAPYAGLGAGEGMLVVPATTRLVAYVSSNAPPPGPGPSPQPGPPSQPTLGGSDEAVSYQIDNAHGGQQPGDVLAPPLNQRWSHVFAEGNVSYPLIVGGRAFVTVATRGPAAPHSYVYALDALTGAVDWGPVDVAPNQYSGPAGLAFDGNRLFVLAQSGILDAVDASSGAVIWSRFFNATGLDLFPAPPTAANGLVYFGDAGCDTGDRRVIAVQQSDGATAWTADTHCEAPVYLSVTATAVEFAVGNCGAFDFDPSSGNTIWSSFCGSGPGTVSPMYQGGLYVRDVGQYGSVVFNSTTGAQRMSGFSAEHPPAFDGSTMITLTGSTLQAEDSTSSRIYWTFTGDGALTTAPIIVNGYVYVGSRNGMVYAISESTGAPAWSGNAGAPITSDLEWESRPLSPRVFLSAGEGLLMVPASNRLVAYSAGSLIQSSTLQSAASPLQYRLGDSDGVAWALMDSTNLRLAITAPSTGMAILSANADLWTANAGYNQDLGIDVDGRIVAWKESGGFSGTNSPNAAFVQAVVPVVAGVTYSVTLKWKTNRAASGATIYAGAGPVAGRYSPTRLSARIMPAVDVTAVESGLQYRLSNSDGTTWQPIDGSTLQRVVTPSANVTALIGASADLWTASPGFNQDLGIFVRPAGGVDQLVAWKESGGFAGTFSPNAAFAQAAVPMTAGTTYTVTVKWKTNRPATGATIYAGAGPIAGRYSPTSLSVQLVASPVSAVSSQQYALAGSDGSTWQVIDAGTLALSVSPAADALAVVGANADLWTENAGFNQDIAVFVSIDGATPQLLTWKESGGFAGTYSPNAAFAQAVLPVQAGHSYAFTLQWKANRAAPGSTIHAGAGPIGAEFSPTSLVVQVVPS